MKERTGRNKPLAGWRMDVEQEGIEAGDEDSTGEEGEWDEVLDAKHSAKAVEGSLDPSGMDFL